MDFTVERILETMKEKNISQVVLCNRLGINKNNFTEWKAGRTKSYTKYINQISDILEVPVDYLYGNTKEKALPTVEELSKDDKLVLKFFNSLTEEQKGNLLGLMRSMVEGQK